MICSTLCYLIQDQQWLMLYRNKKKNDINRNKWIGIGGKIEAGETARQCALREVTEETGLQCRSLTYRGVIYFDQETVSSEKIWVYTSSDFQGILHDCDEGMLAWISQSRLLDLSLWEGDRIFLRMLMEDRKQPFCLHLQYDSDGKLKESVLKEAEAE